MTKRQYIKVKSIVLTTLGLTLAAYLFGFVITTFQQIDYDFQAVMLAILSGAIPGFLVSIFEFWYVQGSAGRWIRQAPFMKSLPY